jgi:hypothetical protein
LGNFFKNNKIYSTVIWDLRVGVFIKGSKIFGPESTYSHEIKSHFFIWLKSKSVFDSIKLKVHSVVNYKVNFKFSYTLNVNVWLR